MSRIHFLNVGDGDCIYIDHNGLRDTLVDVCGGNRSRRKSRRSRKRLVNEAGTAGNYQMCTVPVHPLDYLDDRGVGSLWRFISTHPHMDHLDGLVEVWDNYSPTNFWSTGVDRDKPPFEEEAVRGTEEDWDFYEDLCNGDVDGTTSLEKLAGARFAYANTGKEEGESGDGLHLRGPGSDLVKEAEDSDEDKYNDTSYILHYISGAGDAVFPGDAHDAAWEYALENYSSDLSDIDLLAAPHHGRKSGRSHEFLDTLNPTLTLFGCARSEDLAYDAYNSRDLEVLTTNQAGCVVIECESDQMVVFIENESFAKDDPGADASRTNDMGYYYYRTL